jgi:hypothetical protein
MKILITNIVNERENKMTTNFTKFNKRLNDHFNTNILPDKFLFIADIDNDHMWELYLSSFPEGSNNIFRKKREYDCSSCRHFIKQFGGIVTIDNDYNIVSIWDFRTKNETFDPVLKSLREYVKSLKIKSVYLPTERKIGHGCNKEILESGKSIDWDHFNITIDKSLICTFGSKSVNEKTNYLNSMKDALENSLTKITDYSIEVVLDLIGQNTLHRGNERKNDVIHFKELKDKYNKIPNSKKDIFLWKESRIREDLATFRNHAIGKLLQYISEDTPIDVAVRKYDEMVCGENYHRSKPVATTKMVDDAQKILIDKGLIEALKRRFAVPSDISINDVIFSDFSTKKKMIGFDVFNQIKTNIPDSKKSYDKVEEVSIQDFIDHIVPNITSMKVLFDVKHNGNLVSLITSDIPNSGNLFKHDNTFTWAYNGNITDASMKERVKEFGGRIDVPHRYSIQWNEDMKNQDDLDAHCIEPDGNHIWFRNKGQKHPSSGMLDVDIINPGNKVAVENITWDDPTKMKEGEYRLYVNVFSKRGGIGGFRSEFESTGNIHKFDYQLDMRQKEDIVVAKLKFTRGEGFKVIWSLESTPSVREVWGIHTNKFIKVKMFMYSPNYWHMNKTKVGHKHYMFMLEGCKNDTQPNAFFNEQLRTDLLEDRSFRRSFEVLGSHLKIEPTSPDNQLSGLGFSEDRRNDIIVKVDGHFARTLKIKF